MIVACEKHGFSGQKRGVTDLVDGDFAKNYAL